MSLIPAFLSQRHRGGGAVSRGITSRYFRFLMHSTWSYYAPNDGYLEFGRIRLYSGGVVIPYTGTEVTDQSGNYPGRTASWVFRNDLPSGGGSDVWTTATSVPIDGQWISIDMGTPVNVEAFSITSDGWSQWKRAPGDFEMQISEDGSTWTTVRRYRSHAWRAMDFQTFYVDVVPYQLYGRYWRAYFLQNQGGSYVSVGECEMRAVPASADQCVGGTATASSQVNNLNTPDMAFDNDMSQKWVSANPSSVSAPEWLKYDFGHAVGVGEISLVGVLVAGQEGNAPKDFVIQCSDDNITWRTAGTFPEQPTWALLDQRIYSLRQDFTADSFDTDTTANYDYLGDNPGTWAVADGKVTWTGGSSAQALMMPKGVQMLDGWVEAVSSQLGDAGLVGRVTDNSAYLLMAFTDNNVLSGYYRYGGSYTLISNNPPTKTTITRGLHCTIRMELRGARMYGWVNGWLEATWALPNYTIQKIGMRASNTPTNYDEFRYRLYGTPAYTPGRAYRYWRIVVRSMSPGFDGYVGWQGAAGVGWYDISGRLSPVYSASAAVVNGGLDSSFGESGAGYVAFSAGNLPVTVWADMTTARAVTKLILAAGASPYNQRNPGDMDIECSDDGANWYMAKSLTGLSWASGETKTFTL